MIGAATLMPPRKFQTTFMPIPRQNTRAYKSCPPTKSFKAVTGLITEKGISAEWAEILNGTRPGDELCPGYLLALSQDRSDAGDEARLKVDGALFPKDTTPTDGRPHWPNQRLLVEFKGGKPGTDSKDPFDDILGDPRSTSGQEACGQLASYIAHACNHQQRTAVYAFFVNRRKIRVTRWDKSRIIFTPAFDYVDQPELLCDFLWGFSRLSDKNQGLDPTATLLTPTDPEYAEMDTAAQALASDLSDDEGTIVEFDETNDRPYVFKFQRKMFADSLDPEWPRYKLLVPDENGQREFLVCKPCFVAPGVLGRGTRGYAALDYATKRLVFLKDTWRPSYDGVEQEGCTIKKLSEAQVPNIPTLVCHGDLGQETQSPAHYVTPKGRRPNTRSTRQAANSPQAAASPQPANEVPQGTKRTRSMANAAAKEALLQSSQPDDCPLRKLTHYRIVVAEICMPLCDFKCGKQLISLVNDCILAHWKGVESSHRILHRDISTGNLLILPRVITDQADEKRTVVRKGILTDWELAKQLPADEIDVEVMRQPCRTGTWQFISSFALDFPEYPLRVADDLESFFYVILYNSMRYFDNTLGSVSYCMSTFFDSFTVDDNTYKCGESKRSALRIGQICLQWGATFTVHDKTDKERAHHLNDIIEDLLSWFQARYLLIDQDLAPASKKASSLNPDLALDDEYEQERKRKKQMLLQRRRDELKELESNITSHGAVWRLLSAVLRTAWPEDDKVGDRLVDDSDDGSDDSDATPAPGGQPSRRRRRNRRPNCHSLRLLPVPVRPRLSHRRLQRPVADAGFRTDALRAELSCTSARTSRRSSCQGHIFEVHHRGFWG
ncbi:hypothetical protein C8Q80DRAFT_1263151 [Daedaleopsis nitida]|nr:hypothetical protein C8Q80DRAFT_1263151 [Daedaleopsis nitida]